MSWKLKALIIWILAIPAFTGFPIHYLSTQVLPGVSIGWLLYGTGVYTAVLLVLGHKILKITLMVALAIAVPLVLLGILVSSIGFFINGWDQLYLFEIITHYTRLLTTMMVVIPLALSMVAVLPFNRLERHILQSKRGVRLSEKSILMFLRVFSHTLYYVIPNILEVIREERVFSIKGGLTGDDQSNTLPLSKRIVEIVQMLVNIGVESICSAIRFVPLWAEEISMLPGYTKEKQESDSTDHVQK